MNTVLEYLTSGQKFLKDLVFSKEFLKGIIIGTGIMAASGVISFLAN